MSVIDQNSKEIEVSRDINDIFDDIVLSEEKLINKSYQKGFDDGLIEGNTEGFHLGYHRGAELGAELGYYYAVLYHYSKSSDCHSDRALKSIAACLKLIDDFPRTNDEKADILTLADSIRASFRKTCALLKINGRYPEADQLSF